MKVLKVKFYETKRKRNLGGRLIGCAAETVGVENLSSEQLQDAITMLKLSLEHKQVQVRKD